MKKFLVIIFLAVIVLSGCADRISSLKQECEKNNGVWQDSYNECDDSGISSSWDMKSWCYNMGGAYNDCASPCRHYADKSSCIQVCYRLCEFK
ncbi:MAG: hypothetical protein NTX82_03970 [Candidatus Parcubacteria bacterium]|nr:hypothetical protein [Candidatus Parcubacteria bacterium]